MIIKRILIENYLCYYDKNSFELSNGLNIILGDNGEGKTKFFEAIEWLFEGDDRDIEKLVSAKKINETQVGESFKVSVSITVEQYGNKHFLSKFFLVTKDSISGFSTSNYSLEGKTEDLAGNRVLVDGQTLLDSIFPFQIKKYSMFKGEEQLNIFDNVNALTNLINLFSEAKHYDKYFQIGTMLREKAEKAVETSTKQDKKNVAQYRKIESELVSLSREEKSIEVELSISEDELRKIKENIQNAERHVHNAEALETINSRIKAIENTITKINSQIDENYTNLLFDDNWLLIKFESFHNEFVNKVYAHSKNRRMLQSEFDKQKGVKEGERRAKFELLNNALPLPVGVPSKAHMEEMIKDKVCKVCNTRAEEGSDAYRFMMDKLEAYIESQVADTTDVDSDEILFKYNYINRLENMSISHEDNLKKIRFISSQIQELFKFNADRKIEIENLREKLEHEKSDRDRILGNSNMAQEKLSHVLTNYTYWQRDLLLKKQDLSDYKYALKNIKSQIRQKVIEKDAIDTKSANSFLIKTREILRDIETIFIDTRENKFDEFIDRLQMKSNIFFKQINVDAFTGTILFSKRIKSNNTLVNIELQEDGRTFYKPNQSLLTSMHISILLAISELASEFKEESFPLIFDAPISSFGETKSTQFLNLIYETDNQKILLIKDFLYTDKETNMLSIKKEFEKVRRNKAFWVKLERPFDTNNLKTINTQVISL
jgi:DNA sulfur modification protein DndD